jgi:hypothetical protein
MNTSGCSERLVLRGAPDGKSKLEVGVTLQRSVGVFALRAGAVVVRSPTS